MTGGQSASLSWRQAPRPPPIWGPRTNFCYCQTGAGLLMWGALSDQTTSLSFTIAGGPLSTVILASESSRPNDHILVFQSWRARSPYLYPPGTERPSYTPCSGFPIRRLLRLGGLRRRYWNPPPRGEVKQAFVTHGTDCPLPVVAYIRSKAHLCVSSSGLLSGLDGSHVCCIGSE
jgi:hypothetical protein